MVEKEFVKRNVVAKNFVSNLMQEKEGEGGDFTEGNL